MAELIKKSTRATTDEAANAVSRVVGKIILVSLVILLFVIIRFRHSAVPRAETAAQTSATTSEPLPNPDRYPVVEGWDTVTVGQTWSEPVYPKDPWGTGFTLIAQDENVWMDWCADGVLYHEMPRDMVGHQVVVFPRLPQTVCFRIKPGSAVHETKVSWRVNPPNNPQNTNSAYR